ncbi:hypothetical protein SAMN06309944_2052 [Micrococcales bacterium KH10]|nr:hypothetical protein SAMN06309944_2052 [Micrococcales bacterium KH10]
MVGNQKTVVAAEHARYALKTTDGGVTWADMQNPADGTCLSAVSFYDVLTTSNPALVWLHGRAVTNTLQGSTDGLTTVSTVTQAGSDYNPSGVLIAIDPTNPQRRSSASTTAHYTNWTYSTNQWSSRIYAGRNQGHDNTKEIADLKASPNGWFYIVGDGGLIERTKNGTHAESLAATGALNANDWKAVAFASNSHAVVAGAGGALLHCTTANQNIQDPSQPNNPGTNTSNPPAPSLGNKPPV